MSREQNIYKLLRSYNKMNDSYSVGIPVRNEENGIKQTLECILNQTISPSEIHVCVNGSNDNTINIVSDMAKCEKKINILTSEPGKANAWNTIMKECNNNYVMFCDGDVIINFEAAENILKKFEEKPELVIVGGYNKSLKHTNDTLFSKYFTSSNIIPSKQNWISGALYMTKAKELFELSAKYHIEMMPKGIINEDGFLGLVTTGHKEIIYSAYNISLKATTFHDWHNAFKRTCLGQKQLKRQYSREKYPQLYESKEYYAAHPNMIWKNLIGQFNGLENWQKKIAITTFFFFKKILRKYYITFGNLDYNPVWKESKSTKAWNNINKEAFLDKKYI
jgi:glycosyltransferase involved in cell wall biosynthesis